LCPNVKKKKKREKKKSKHHEKRGSKEPGGEVSLDMQKGQEVKGIGQWNW